MDIKNFYKGKKVLITGHTGFKGSWLAIWLDMMGAEVSGFSLAPKTRRDNFVLSGIDEHIYSFYGDIRDRELISDVFEAQKPDIVFHLAAQPLVRLSYKIPYDTYATNVMGTMNVLEAIRNTKSVKAGVMITTDKCYENKEHLEGYRETDPLGGYDPYSSSKACAEILISSYRRSFLNPDDYASHKKAVASARAGNVIGGGDWAKDRIIPDCIRAIEKDQPIMIHSPNAVRPWQHVLEPLYGYLTLGMLLCEDPTEYSESYNFGPDSAGAVTVLEIAEKLVKSYGKGSIKTEVQKDAPHEAGLLTLNIDKAKSKLGFRPRLSVDEAVAMTADWYREYKNCDVLELCRRQIEEYSAK